MKSKTNILNHLLTILFAAGFISCTKSLETQITINAPQERVWSIFTDTKSYAAWNPMILQFKGELKQDATIEVELKQPGKDPMVFQPQIIAFDRGRLLEWEGLFIGKWLFTGIHRFEIVPVTHDETLFKQSENFSGIAIPFFDFNSTKQAFEMMNEALKKRAEGK